jgi:hypothetical protein
MDHTPSVWCDGVRGSLLDDVDVHMESEDSS